MAKKILIVDDDPIVVKYLTNIFNDNGYETFSASNGFEGEKMVHEVLPDLITLDLEMPEEWGPRFYRKIMKQKEFKTIPVIVISGLPSSKYALPKTAGYLSKPFEPDALITMVKAIFVEEDDVA
jgi:DNA-binding response OmpR family regulator